MKSLSPTYSCPTSTSSVKSTGFSTTRKCIQICGGIGVSNELPVARTARQVRSFRIYDGPSEVHRRALAKRAIRTITDSQ
ncbi:acyl-CoA dehydrogenase family protein [Mycolicibacterium sp.]|uniref:acyl-CoA dehydrogenase family protein n=1 Tax=Mycolicibacterium sp. TaxID=2320850 RepID=UPI003D0A594B